MPVFSEQIAALRQQHYNSTLVDVRWVHESLAIFRVRPDFRLTPPVPGQYTTLGLGHWEPRHPEASPEVTKPGDETRLIRRQYSLSHPVLTPGGALANGSQEVLEFYIVMVNGDGGEMPPALTPRLFQLKPNDRLYTGEKVLGHYVLGNVHPDDAILLLSTGTGEAPHNYMLWQLLQQGHRGPILAVCCVRLTRDLAYLDVHRQLMEKYPNYRYLSLATREPGQSGKCYIQDLLKKGDLEKGIGRPLDPARTHVYLCGNPQMIGVPTVDRTTRVKTYPKTVGMIELLEQRGFTADNRALKIHGNVHFEEYW
jgi:ferredoxin/flavodoxin---NADP+ reductase